MRKRIFTFFSLFLVFLMTGIRAYAQQCEWAKAGTGSKDCSSNAIVTDAVGNVYISGYFKSPKLVFGSVTLTNSVLYRDLFVAKYDATGNLLWAKDYGPGVANSMAVDISGNIYIYGSMTSLSMSLGSITLVNKTGTDFFLVKLDNTGSVMWAVSQRAPAPSSTPSPTSVKIDKSGNVYVTGQFDSSITIGGIYLSDNTASGNIYLAKYDPTGNVLWAKSSIGPGSNSSNSLSLDESGNCYITGQYDADTIDFDGIKLTNPFSNSSSLFLAKYDASGNILWAKGTNASDNAIVVGFNVSADLFGNIYVSGAYTGSTQTFNTFTLTNINALEYDIFLAKYDKTGTLIWVKSAGGDGSDAAAAMLTDPAGNILLTGKSISSSITFGTTTIPYPSIFITKYDGSGNVIWAKGGSGNNNGTPMSMARASSGSIYITGFYTWNPFTLGTITLPPTLDPSLYSNVFLAKYTDLTAGVETLSYKNEEIAIYPNPAQDQLTISNTENITHITISNLLGQIVYDHEFDTDKVIVNTKDLSGGVYIMRINNSEIRQFIKQ